MLTLELITTLKFSLIRALRRDSIIAASSTDGGVVAFGIVAGVSAVGELAFDAMAVSGHRYISYMTL